MNIFIAIYELVFFKMYHPILEVYGLGLDSWVFNLIIGL